MAKQWKPYSCFVLCEILEKIYIISSSSINKMLFRTDTTNFNEFLSPKIKLENIINFVTDM